MVILWYLYGNYIVFLWYLHRSHYGVMTEIVPTFLLGKENKKSCVPFLTRNHWEKNNC